MRGPVKNARRPMDRLHFVLCKKRFSPQGVAVSAIGFRVYFIMGGTSHSRMIRSRILQEAVFFVVLARVSATLYHCTWDVGRTLHI